MDEEANVETTEAIETSEPVEPVQSGELTSTVEFKAQERQAKDETQVEVEDPATEEEAGEKSEVKQDVKSDNILITELQKKIEAAERRAAELESRFSMAAQPPVQNVPPQKTILDFEDTEILDLLNENPKEFLTKFKESVEGSLISRIEEQNRQQSVTKSLENTFRSFAEKNPDFDPMWDSGDLKRFMDANPGHNAISAYYELTAAKREAAVKAEIEKARKEAERKAIESVKVKKSASSIPSAPASVGGKVGVPNELKSTRTGGGLISVLAARSAQRTGSPL